MLSVFTVLFTLFVVYGLSSIFSLNDTATCELKKCQFMRYAPPEVHGLKKASKLDQNRKCRQSYKRRQNKKLNGGAKNNCRKKGRQRSKQQSCPVTNANIVESPFEALSSSSDDQEVGGLKVMSIRMGSEKKQVR